MSFNTLAIQKLKKMVEDLKRSSFFDFLKKEYQENHTFVIQSNLNNLNQQIMYNDSQKKSMIYQMALILLIADNRTTNLDVKNALHNVFPGIGLTQTEVSVFMAELSKEKTDWTVKNNGKYNEYTFAPITASIHVDITPVVSTPVASTPVPDPVKADPTNLMAIAQTASGKTVSLGKVGTHSAAFLQKLDSKVKVAFATGYDPCLMNTVDKFEARKLFKKITGAKHNDVRTVSIKTYLKRNNIV